MKREAGDPTRGDIVLRVYEMSPGHQRFRIVVERHEMATLFTASDYDVVKEKLIAWSLRAGLTPLVWMKYPGKDPKLVEHWSWT